MASHLDNHNFPTDPPASRATPSPAARASFQAAVTSCCCPGVFCSFLCLCSEFLIAYGTLCPTPVPGPSGTGHLTTLNFSHLPLLMTLEDAQPVPLPSHSPPSHTGSLWPASQEAGPVQGSVGLLWHSASARGLQCSGWGVLVTAVRPRSLRSPPSCVLFPHLVFAQVKRVTLQS